MKASVSVTQRLAEIVERGVVALRGVGEAVKQSVHAFEHRARPEKTAARQQRGADAGLRRPAGMHALGPGAFGQIFDDAGGEAAGDAERIDDLFGVEAQRGADAGGGAHHAENRGRMEAGLVHRLRHHGRKPAHRLGADRDAEQRRGAVRLVALAGRQHRRHHHRAGMHRAALEGVVEILAMRRGAVDESGAGRAQRAAVADRRARPVVVEAGKRGFDVILVARGDAKTDHVDQQVLAFGADGGRQRLGIERDDARGELFGDGNFGKIAAHEVTQPRRYGARCRPRMRLASATTVKVITSISRPITEMAPRSPLSLRS